MADGRLNVCKECKRAYAQKQGTESVGKCIVCGATSLTSNFRKKIGWGKYCGHKCAGKDMFEMGVIKPPVRYGRNNTSWKGRLVGYSALHNWVERILGKPSKCDHCGTTEKRVYHWANKSHKYKREKSDWLRLCVPCHRRYDAKHRRVIIGGCH